MDTIASNEAGDYLKILCSYIFSIFSETFFFLIDITRNNYLNHDFLFFFLLDAFL